MSNGHIAEDFLRVIKSKIGFDGMIQSPYNSPTITTAKVHIEGSDIETYSDNPIINSVMKFLKERVATNYEYERIEELVKESKSEKIAERNKQRTQRSKYEKLLMENCKICNNNS